MEHKSAAHVEIKSADQGLVSCVFSTLNVKDADGDVTLSGAFEDGADCVLSAYGHQSWAGALPVGKGRLRVTPNEAICDAEFFMDTAHGRDCFAVVKRLADLGSWSYGFEILDSEYGTHNGEQVRYLKRLRVWEVSPVLIGAGVGVRTLSAKSGYGGTVPMTPEDMAATEFARFVALENGLDEPAVLRDIRECLDLNDIRDRLIA